MISCGVLAVSPAGATCGSANCFLVTGTQEGVGSKGEITLNLSFRYVVQDRKLEGTHGVREVLTPKVDFENGELEPDHHREIRTQNSLVQLDLAWGVTGRLSLAASLPLLNERDHEHYDDVGTPNESFTRQDGSSGFGDARLGGRYAFLVRTKDLLVGGLTLKLPTGQYRLRDSEGEINEPTIQPGSGSTDLIASAYYAHQWIPVRFEYFVSGSHKWNSENDLDYRFGAESLANAGISYRVRDRWSWSVQLNGRRTAADRYLGDKVPSTGATFVNLTPGVRCYMSTSSSFYFFLQAPVYQDVRDAQLAPRTGLLTGLSKTF
ncbi:MAG TPA: hypothetical protein VGK94_08605 [Candidatus Polarisedimenticolia bacterium]